MLVAPLIWPRISAKVSDTYWYLTGVPELMAIAAKRFERFAQDDQGGEL
jgi:integrase/recombinase XerD